MKIASYNPDIYRKVREMRSQINEVLFDSGYASKMEYWRHLEDTYPEYLEEHNITKSRYNSIMAGRELCQEGGARALLDLLRKDNPPLAELVEKMSRIYYPVYYEYRREKRNA